MLSSGEVFFLEQCCLAGIRGDGRGPREARKPEIQRGVTPGTQASTFIRLGECALILNARELEAAGSVDSGAGATEEDEDVSQHLFLRLHDTLLSPPPLYGIRRSGGAETEVRPDRDFQLAVMSLLARNVQRPARHEVHIALLSGGPSYPTALSLGLYDVLSQLNMQCDCLISVVARVADVWLPDPTLEEESASSALILAAINREACVLDVLKTGSHLLDVADVAAGLRAATEAGKRLWDDLSVGEQVTKGERQR